MMKFIASIFVNRWKLFILAAEAFIHFIICVSVYIISVSMATEEMGLADDDERVYLDSGCSEAFKLEIPDKTASRTQA